jgi:hypothetical protein
MTESRCILCGEPMPEGEEVFKYHGYSGPCPKPPLPMPKHEVVAEYAFYDDPDGSLWITVKADRQWREPLGPFDTATERQRAFDDLMAMMRSVGAKDLPSFPQ